jgi:chemotaxis protein MotB
MAQAFGVQTALKVTDIPKGTSIIAQEFSPGRPEPTPINEIWQKTDDSTDMSLEVECSEEYTIEQGTEGLNAGVRIEVKQKLEELLDDTRQDAYELAASLNDQIAAGEVELETRGRMIIVRIREKGSFISGSSEMSAAYKDVMREVKSVLALKPGKIEVQGHTDDLPIKTARFRSNWELSSSRAVSVAHELMKGGELPSRRFQVSGYADTLPLAPNDSTENRIRNRRVEILIKQGVEDELSDEDINVLKEDKEGQDILRELNLEPEYLFDLEPDEIF